MRSILLLPLVARCLETIDVCIWRMFVFMSVVVTVWGHDLLDIPYIYIYILFTFFCQNKIVIIQRVIPHKYCSYTYTRLFNIDYCINI